MQKLILILILVVITFSPLSAEPITLEYRFHGADSYLLTYRIEGENTISGNSYPFVIEGRDRLDIKRRSDGNFQITARNERFVIDLKIESAPNVDAHDCQLLRKGEVQVFTINPSGQVIDGYTGYKLLTPLRPEPLIPGKVYTDTEAVDVPGFSRAITEARWKLRGVKVKQGARIARVEGDISVRTGDHKLESRGPYHYHFDLDQGLITRSRIQMNTRAHLKNVSLESSFFYNWDVRPVRAPQTVSESW